MSLVFIYNDDLVADKRMILKSPHALGQTVSINKLFLSKDKTFAFGSVGPTLSTLEKAVMGEILADGLNGLGHEHRIGRLINPEWLNLRDGINLYLMTRDSTFILAKSDTGDGWWLERADPSIPIGGGTGMQMANIALLEGVKATDVVPLVADITYSVSAEFDHIHRSQLKEMAK